MFQAKTLVTIFAVLSPALADAAAPKYAETVKPLMDKYCANCHNAEKHKGSVDLSGFSDNLSVIKDRKLWAKCLEQIENGDMPPDDEPQLEPAQKAALLQQIREISESFDLNDPAFRDPGPSVLRRLSRVEYENTVKALTGLSFDAGTEAGIASEDNGSAYTNLAAMLTLQPALMEKYFTAADRMLDRLFLSPEERKAIITKGGKQKNQAQADETAAKAFQSRMQSMSAEAFVTDFMKQAYRRPVDAKEVQRVLQFHTQALAKGESAEGALRRALKPMLVSPHFLFRVERDRAAKGSKEAYRISDHELAVRLSYFLWSGPPDQALMAAADKGELSQPKLLEAQVKRMLLSPATTEFTKNFATHWLQVDRIAEARPSREFFPTFSDTLRKAMKEEVEHFMNKMREEDRPVTDLLTCDYVYANSELAKHYGLPEVKGKEFQRVALTPDSPRGGLLGMAGVMAMNAHTNRTSPTLRGKYVMEVVFGKPPPPPPNNVAPLKPGKKGEPPKSLREQLAQHATQASCAGCHKKIDPLGFALDNFDAIGAWRESTPENKLDTEGVLPSGEKFNGVRELKQIILKQQDVFIHNVIEQTLIYSLGRELDYFDEAPVRKIQSEMKPQGNRFSALILGIVQSYPFQYRKNTEPAALNTAKK